MKHGTAYAKRVKRVYAQIKKLSKPPKICGASDPLDQLVLSVLSQETTLGNASKAFNKLLHVMVDLNELRVSSPREIADVIAPYIPNSRTCASRLVKLLNEVFNRENALNLETLRSMGKREAKHRLEELAGIEPYHVASVVLWSLGGHAIPVNAKLLAALRKDELVEPNASVAEVQSFLERHIPPAEAKTFCLTMAALASHSRARPSKATPTAKKSTRGSGTKKNTGSSKTARREKAARRN